MTDLSTQAINLAPVKQIAVLKLKSAQFVIRKDEFPVPHLMRWGEVFTVSN